MAHCGNAHARFDRLGATMLDRENVDEICKFEMVLDAADIDVNLVAGDVQIYSDKVSLFALIQYRHNKQRPLPLLLVPLIE